MTIPLMNKHKVDLFKAILMLSQEQLHYFLFGFLSDYYTTEELTQSQGHYIYAKGEIPVGLVAHLDTVHKVQPLEDQIFYDSEKGVMWSPVGIGGDDRCGVFLIMNLLFYGYKPTILFTWDEEIGGVGSRQAAEGFFPTLNFLMQFDRKGTAQSVYYSLDNKDFETYINKFGFTTHRGSYTDIWELCPEWKCAGVNLSAGYENEHSTSEIILLKTFYDTLEKASRILQDQSENPVYFEYTEIKRTPYYHFKPDYYDDYGWSNASVYDGVTCSTCGEYCYDYDLVCGNCRLEGRDVLLAGR